MYNKSLINRLYCGEDDIARKSEYDKAIRKAVKDEIQNIDKTAVDNNAILKRIENR